MAVVTNVDAATAMIATTSARSQRHRNDIGAVASGCVACNFHSVDRRRNFHIADITGNAGHIERAASDDRHEGQVLTDTADAECQEKRDRIFQNFRNIHGNSIYCSKSERNRHEADQGTDDGDSSKSVDLIIKAVIFHIVFPPK